MSSASLIFTTHLKIINAIIPRFVEEVGKVQKTADPKFVKYFLHLLLRDTNDGLHMSDESKMLSVCKFENFFKKALEKYLNPLDATLCHMKISYYLSDLQLLNYEYIKEKCQKVFDEQLDQLMWQILQYPETCNDKQIEELFWKIQIFIISSYNIGSPKDHVLMKLARQTLNSIIGKNDLQYFVLKKKYHRLEYMHYLGRTVCGILIYNNQSSHNKKHIRNLSDNLEMVEKDIKETIKMSLNRAIKLIDKGIELIQNIITIDNKQQILQTLWPIIKVHEVNKYIILFVGYKQRLKNIANLFERAEYLIDVNKKRFQCVVSKINDILKYRSAIEAELIYPHFAYLSEMWMTLSVHLEHLFEIGKVTDHLNGLVNASLEQKYYQIVEEISIRSKQIKNPIRTPFKEIFNELAKDEGKIKFNMLNIQPYTMDHCTLTITLTNGLLVSAKLKKKLCENVKLPFGFANIDNAKYAEQNFCKFLKAFRTAVITSTDLILLFHLDAEILENFKLTEEIPAKNKTIQIQTEFVEENLTSKRNNNLSWNIWDYHRKTIQWANIRQHQTHSTQTTLSYGKSNVQNQTYYTRKHMGI